MTSRIAILTTPAYHHYIYLHYINELHNDFDVFFYDHKPKRLNFDFINFLSVKHEEFVFKSLNTNLDLSNSLSFNYIDNLLAYDWSAYDVVVVYGVPKISSTIINAIGPSKLINHHGGVLPYIRGLDSDYWSVLNNRLSDIGCTLHVLTEKLDAGHILLSSSVSLFPTFIWQLRALKAALHAELLLQYLSFPNSGTINNLSDGVYCSRMQPALKIYSSILYFLRK